MKKITFLLAALVLFAAAIYAKPVNLTDAQTVALNFYTQTYETKNPVLILAYTEKSDAGQALYYVFNVNRNDGFVIVSAEDAATPILGYSNTGHYNSSNHSSNFIFWMGNYKNQINYIQKNNIQQTKEVQSKWTKLSSNQAGNTSKNPVKVSPSVAPLLQTLWSQSPYYNELCPGGSVTGCVATAMAQVMRYWSYPARGAGSHCYNDIPPGYNNNYGQLCADFDTSQYVWSAMPYSVTSANDEVAKLMYDCGVSVDMDYSPSGSGAYVISADDSVCAQNSYITYFGYNPATIQGLYRRAYSDNSWDSLLENELNNFRVIEYAGFGNQGGHTWVCDGYSSAGAFHMNWGWSGADNGYFTLDALTPGGVPLSTGEEALIGIEPMVTTAAFNPSPTIGCAGTTVTFNDHSYSPTSIASWQWSFPGGSPSTSSLKNPVITYNIPGIYPVTEIVTSSTNATDTLTQTTCITIDAPAFPLTEGFESTVFPPQGWAINNPEGHSTIWAPRNDSVGGYGQSLRCMYYNNCGGGVVGEYDQIHTSLVDFTGDAYPFMTFDVAYAPWNSIYSDTLAVYYSTDCGTTWNRVYLKGGMKLCTTGGLTVDSGAHTDADGCFQPLSNNWRTDTILLHDLAGQPNVMFSFENRSGNGSNMYIDNINIPSSALGIKNMENPISVSVYPNPNNGGFTLDIQNMQGEQKVQIFNVLGQKVYEQTLYQNKTQIKLNQPAGVYIYQVLSIDGKMLSEGKLIVAG